tara:strand:+ start:1485 stop:2207 length:723 start_codon:yes stop_codon:yes gene_type:complete
MSKVLILGDGLLGKELHLQSGDDIISRSKDGFDICDIKTFYKLTKIEHGVAQWCPYDVIINAVGHTDTYSSDKESHWNVNYEGVANLVDFCNKWKIKLVQIVTDYIYAGSVANASETDIPVHCRTWYGYTKLLGDAHVQLKCNDYLCIRGTHKETPFPYDEGYIHQVGNYDYVDKVASIILQLANSSETGIINVGTELKTMYCLAKQTRDDVIPVNKKFNEEYPSDVSMDISKLKSKGIK